MNPKCVCCGGDWFPVKYTHLGLVCSDCRVPCATCTDWLAGEPEVVHEGKRHHASCFVDAIEEAA